MVALGKYVAEDDRPQTPEKKLLQAFAHPVSLLIFAAKLTRRVAHSFFAKVSFRPILTHQTSAAVQFIQYNYCIGHFQDFEAYFEILFSLP